MIKRTILILSLLVSLLCASRAQVMMIGPADSLSYITSPLDVDSLFYWFAADVGVTDSLGGAIATNEGVGTWNDLSGNGHHVTQTTNGARPVWKATGGPGSKPTIQFDGSNDFLASASHWWGSDDLTVFVVMKFGNATRDAVEAIVNRIADGANRQWEWFARNSGAPSYASNFIAYNDGNGANNEQYLSGAPFKSTNYKTHVITHNGSLATLFSDGASVALTESVNGTGNGTIYDSSELFVIGARQVTTSPQGWLQGSISEIIVFSRALTTAERTAIENYLNKKYDLY